MSIDINPANKGKYSARAKAAGRSVQAQASHDLAPGSHASKKAKQRANFAKNARKWRHSGRKARRK